jgi:hypothetical protein
MMINDNVYKEKNPRFLFGRSGDFFVRRNGGYRCLPLIRK